MNTFSMEGLISVVFISLVSLIGALLFFYKKGSIHKYVMPLVGLSAGALFGDAFFHLIPEVLENESVTDFAMIAVILGIVSFFVLEKFLMWHHHHDTEEHAHDKELPVGKLILFSDALHNFLDGVIIAVSYSVSVPVGIATTIAVILHELPQEIGDFGLLIHSGYSRSKAVLFNFISSLSAVLGFLVASFFIFSEDIVSLVSAFAAGSFIYIAGSDLIPELKNKNISRASIIEFAFMLLGVVLMYLLLFLE
jgi:zinc and cadmium transporter